jgi:hypothetical protein
MKEKIHRCLLASSVVLFLFISIALFPWLAIGKTKPGEVIYACILGTFYQKGGDPATHVGDHAPLISTTVFEGLVDMGVNLKTLPAVATSWKIAPD